MRCLLALLSLSVALASTLYADDGAASIATGGLIAMKREPRIVMAKEVLTISSTRVLVDYDFRNDSDQDITTEVAFPIPAYIDDPDGPRWQLAGFDDFQLWIDGASTKYSVETRAFVGHREITHLLINLGIDAASFGHEHPDNRGNTVNDLVRLSRSQREQLFALKAIDGVDDLGPDWSVEKKYHWTQTFPAHAIVHIRHEYTPVLGNSNTVGDPANYEGKSAIPEYASVCPDENLRTTLAKTWNHRQEDDSPISIEYVDFILTTANTWKRPIEDFTLIVERPHIKFTKPYPAELTTYVSFCWDGPITKLDADQFSAHTTNLIPAKELRIGFINVDPARMKK